MDWNLEIRAGEYLTRRNETLATAESCTGGLVAHRLTNVAGCSAYFQGGIVAYSNALKSALLDVPEEMLAAHGAVSEPVAHAMAEGVCQRCESTWGIGITGIAGPSGGTPEKPVGLVYIAVTGPAELSVERRVFEGDRQAVKEQSAERALELLVEHLSLEPTE